MANSELQHPIQVVARRTGLSAEVIRVWEKRYGAVVPKRSQTQRRFYSDADMERLRLLKRVTEMGRRISDIAGLSDEALAHLAAEDTVSITSVPSQSAPPSADTRTQEYLEACLAAVKDLNPPALETALVQASMGLGISVLFEEILTPLLSTIGAEWRDGNLRGIHERVASAQVRTFLGNLLYTSNTGHVGPMLLVTTPTGQYCELGALMLAVTAASSGWNAIYLGADTPAGKIVAAAIHTSALAVSLSITRASDPCLPEELRQLRRYLPDNVRLLVSSSGAWGYREVLDEIGATHVGPLRKLRQELEALRAPVQTLLAEQRVYSESREDRDEWIWEQDPSGRYIYSNSAVKDLLGYEPEEVLGKHYLGLFTREYREYMAGDFPESTDPKHCFFRIINRYCHKDGHEVITESTGESIFDKEGKLIKWQGMDRDITARKRFEDALQQVQPG